MISDDDAERAVDYLRDTAQIAAQARANRAYLEQYLRTVRAQQMLASEAGTIAEREADALVSVPYRQAMTALREAVEMDERYRFLREAALAKIDAWRTQSSNLRAARP